LQLDNRLKRDIIRTTHLGTRINCLGQSREGEKMKKLAIGFCLLALLCGGVLLLSQGTAHANPFQRALRIGAAQIFVTNSQLDPDDGFQVLHAFVPTGSTNRNCLMTLGDTSFVALGTLSFCAPRNPAAFGEGVLISVFYPQPAPPDLTLSLTLYQEGAKRYGAPVLCRASDGC
jgi:hypothetical protein